MIKKKITILNKLGLHVRVVARIAETILKYETQLTFSKGEKQVDASNMLKVLSLRIRCGEAIDVVAVGKSPEIENECMNEILEILNNSEI